MDLSYESLLDRILCKCKKNSLRVDVYLFGSFLHKSNYQDIDIIVIYQDKESINDFKKNININTIGAPIDYVFFNRVTEHHVMLNFLKKVQSKLIYSGG